MGILIFGVLEAIGDGMGTTVNYWAEVDVQSSSNTQKKRALGCAAASGQQLTQPDDVHWSDSPSSWAFTSAIHSTLTSCTYTNTAPTAAATGTLSCPDLPSPVSCPPASGGKDSVCLTEDNTFSLPGIPGIKFGGDVRTSALLSYCSWQENP